MSRSCHEAQIALGFFLAIVEGEMLFVFVFVVLGCVCLVFFAFLDFFFLWGPLLETIAGSELLSLGVSGWLVSFSVFLLVLGLTGTVSPPRKLPKRSLFVRFVVSASFSLLLRLRRCRFFRACL